MAAADQIEALMTAARTLLDQAKDDPQLAERLLADPSGVIAQAAGHPVPDGIMVTATREADGKIGLAAAADPDFAGELDDALLDEVAGGDGLKPGAGGDDRTPGLGSIFGRIF